MHKLLIVLSIIPTLSFAQYDSVKKNDVIRFSESVYRTYTAPLHWKKKNWVEFASVAGGTAILTLADQPVRNFWISREQNNVLNQVNTIGYHYGKPYTAFVVAGCSYATGLMFKNRWARETGVALTTALVSVGVLEMGLKTLVGRARPNQNLGNYHTDFMNREISHHSFPSGHASIAFTISFVMAKQSESIPAKIFFYSLAASTAVCRLYSDAHWISDVAFGGVLAWYCSESALKHLRENHFKKKRNTEWNVTPYPGGITVGILFN